MPDITRLRLEMPFTKEQMDGLVSIAVRIGWQKEDPTKAWRQEERNMAARYAMERLVSIALKEFGSKQ